MKIKPKVERATPISVPVRGVKVRYDPVDHADGLQLTEDLGRALVKTGHWVEVEKQPSLKIANLTDQYTLEDVLREGETLILDALFDGRNEAMQVLVKHDLIDLAQLTFQQRDYSPVLFADEAAGRCTIHELKFLYGTPLEDFGVKRFKEALKEARYDSLSE